MSKEMCCPICGQYIDVDEIYQQGYEDGFASVKDLGKLYSEIRAEAIDKCVKELEIYKTKLAPMDWVIVNQCIVYLEQLKERKND